jgi:hypothetical protein
MHATPGMASEALYPSYIFGASACSAWIWILLAGAGWIYPSFYFKSCILPENGGGFTISINVYMHVDLKEAH